MRCWETSLALPALDSLARAGQLKAEARNDAEVGRLLAMARTRLADARLTGVAELIEDATKLVGPQKP